MEASALQVPTTMGRLSVALPLLRLRSDEQLVALFRAGSDDAFNVIHERYRQRLFAYVRQMLSAATRQDAEDVLQDVFVRAYGALRQDDREVNVRAWLYRVAHNRCVDHLRRPAPAPGDVFATSRKPLHDPIEEAQRREDLRRLVADVSRLPAQQRSALLMREMNGLSYQDLADALDVTVPAVKSLLVRARVGLVEAAEARDAACEDIRRDLVAAYDRGVKASGRARRHMRECQGCSEYRTALRGMRRSFACLAPGATLGPIALVAKLAGLGGAGGGAAAGSAMTAGGGTVIAGATACKVAAVVCTAAIAGGAVEVQRLTQEPGKRRDAARAATAKAVVPPLAPVAERHAPARTVAWTPGPAVREEAARRAPTARPQAAPAPRPDARRAAPATPVAEHEHVPATPAEEALADGTAPGDAVQHGGTAAPASEPAVTPPAENPGATPTTAPPAGPSPAAPSPGPPTAPTPTGAPGSPVAGAAQEEASGPAATPAGPQATPAAPGGGS